MNIQTGKTGVVLLIAAAIAITAGIAYYIQSNRKLPEGLIAASGRVEGDRIMAAAKFPGRLREVRAREGDELKAGVLVALLEDDSVQARTEQARQMVNAATAQLNGAEASLDVAEKEIPMAITVADAGVSQAEAMLIKAQAVALQSKRDADRHQALYEKGVIEKHRLEQAELALKVADSDQRAATENVRRAKEALAQARLGQQKIQARRQEVAALAAQKQRAEAAVTESGAALKDMQIVTPAAGVVLTRLREPGEVVMPGGAVLEMVNLDQLYLKVYVPESRIGQIRLGLPARVYVDSQPDIYYDARVSYISAKAEFTPKEVQTTDERVKLMYAVKLTLIANPGHKLTPGLPADAVIRWKENAEWQKPRWH